MADASARLSKMAISYIWVTTSPESPNSLLSGDTREGENGRLAARVADNRSTTQLLNDLNPKVRRE